MSTSQRPNSAVELDALGEEKGLAVINEQELRTKIKTTMDRLNKFLTDEFKDANEHVRFNFPNYQAKTHDALNEFDTHIREGQKKQERLLPHHAAYYSEYTDRVNGLLDGIKQGLDKTELNNFERFYKTQTPNDLPLQVHHKVGIAFRVGLPLIVGLLAISPLGLVAASLIAVGGIGMGIFSAGPRGYITCDSYSACDAASRMTRK